jgi:SPP1 family predicted phage head-tail adaptor
MNASELNRQVIIEKRIVIQDEMGGITNEWVDYKKVWAAVLIGSGREFYGAKKVNTELTGIIKIRYKPEINKFDYRVKYGVRNFDILYVIDPLAKHEITELHVKERL